MKKILFCCVMMVLMSITVVYAEQCSITCTTEAYGTDVTISGKIQNATGTNQVTLMVGEPENIIYINQVESMETGEFEFSFKLWDAIPESGYNFKIGSDSGAEPYVGVLKETKAVEAVRSKFINANITVGIYGYEPSIWGPVSCIDGTQAIISILNKTDNVVIAEETITPEDGTYYLSYDLPSLLNRKEYEVSVICKDEAGKILADMSVNVDSKILAVNIAGQACTASDVVIDAKVKSTNTDLIDKETSFSGNESIDVSVPNIVSGAQFDFVLDGYQTIYVEEGSVHSGEYTLNVTGEESVPIFDVAVNVANMDNINDKVFVVYYPSPYVQIHKESKYNQNNMTVITNDAGVLKYKINESIPSGKLLTKTVNVMQFYSQTPGTYKIECMIRGEEIK